MGILYVINDCKIYALLLGQGEIILKYSMEIHTQEKRERIAAK